MNFIRHFCWLAFVAVFVARVACAQNPEAPQSLTVPVGTRIITVLRSPVHTTSAVPDSGVYLESVVPIVVDNHVAIPAHSLIQGTVETAKRPGHFDRNSRFRFHFTTVVFPNNHVETIDAVLQSIPGTDYRKKDSAGTTGTVDQVEKTLPGIGGLAFAGALFGSVRHIGIGGFLPGAGLGVALGVGKVLLTRGDPIVLHEGTRMEIALKAPLTISRQVIPEGNASTSFTPQLITRADTNEPSASESPTNTANPRRPVLNPWPMQKLFYLPWY